MLFPLFIFISVIFFTSIMANRSEIIAILSSGISFRTFLTALYCWGTFIYCFFMVVQSICASSGQSKMGNILIRNILISIMAVMKILRRSAINILSSIHFRMRVSGIMIRSVGEEVIFLSKDLIKQILFII